MTLDIKREWMNIARCLQAASVKSGNRGIAVVSISIVISDDNNPVMWTDPQVVKINPISSAEQIITLLREMTSIPKM